MSFDQADVIYVNAGVTHPAECWLDGLRDGGRLLIPLTTDTSFTALKTMTFDPIKAMRSGVYFLIERRGDSFDARGLLPTAIIPAVGARDHACETALAAALEKGGWNNVTRLVRGEPAPQERCWLQGPGWCLVCD